jgi:hypothetical protein
MRRRHVIYKQKSPAKKLSQCRKRPYRRSSAFDHTEVTVRGNADYPRMRHSAQKLPKGAAGLSVQKSPTGAAGIAQ